MQQQSAEPSADPIGEPTVTDLRERVRGAGGANMDAALAVILSIDALIVFALLTFAAPSQYWVLPVVLGMPFVVFTLITVFLWKPWERRFPAQPQFADAIVRRGQSISLGRGGSMNNCMTLAADARHLHLIPFSLLRMTGAKVVSIPWSRVSEVGPPPRLSFMLTRAMIDGRYRLGAPEWAMQFARIGDGAPPGDEADEA